MKYSCKFIPSFPGVFIQYQMLTSFHLITTMWRRRFRTETPKYDCQTTEYAPKLFSFSILTVYSCIFKGKGVRKGHHFVKKICIYQEAFPSEDACTMEEDVSREFLGPGRLVCKAKQPSFTFIPLSRALNLSHHF